MRKTKPKNLNAITTKARSLLSDFKEWELVEQASILHFNDRENQDDWERMILVPNKVWEISCIRSKVSHKLVLVSVLGTWRYTKTVYRFDDTLKEELLNMELKVLPIDVFKKFPNYAIYVDNAISEYVDNAISEKDAIKGFWASVGTYNGRPELRFAFNTDLADSIYYISLILQGDTLEDACNATVKDYAEAFIEDENKEEFLEKAYEGMVRSLTPSIKLLVYLCSQNPDIQDLKRDKEYSSSSKTVINPNKRLDPAKEITCWNVGSNIGKDIKAVRQDLNNCERKSVRPHIRKAHWHGFYKGKRDGEREYFHKWIAPVLVTPRSK